MQKLCDLIGKPKLNFKERMQMRMMNYSFHVGWARRQCLPVIVIIEAVSMSWFTHVNPKSKLQPLFWVTLTQSILLQPEGGGMGETYQPFVIIEAVYMGWFTLEFFVRFLSSPSKVKMIQHLKTRLQASCLSIIKCTELYLVDQHFENKILSDWVCTEVDEHSRPFGNPALLHISCLLQVNYHVLESIAKFMLCFLFLMLDIVGCLVKIEIKLWENQPRELFVIFL